jgi:glucuronosyltransferase
VKLFITHGGLLSVQEAYWHAVPMLGIPLFMDQHHNIAKAVRDGGADEINIAQLSMEDLIKKIKKLINNPR